MSKKLRSGKSLILELHAWQGVSFRKYCDIVAVSIGFFSICYMPESFRDFLVDFYTGPQ